MQERLGELLHHVLLHQLRQTRSGCLLIVDGLNFEITGRILEGLVATMWMLVDWNVAADVHQYVPLPKAFRLWAIHENMMVARWEMPSVHEYLFLV